MPNDENDIAETKTFTVHVPICLHAEFKSLCALQNKTITDALTELISDYINQSKQNG